MQPFTARNRGRWLAALLGLLLPAAFAPFHFYPAAIILPALLFALWDDQSAREAAWRGFCFGFASFVSGTYWLYISIRGFGGAPIPVVAALMIGLFMLMALYPALAGYLSGRLPLASRALRFCLLWPALFTFGEWLRMWLFTGFPWLSLGYAQIDGPLRGWVPVVGVHGVTFVTLVLSGALLTFVRGSRRDRIAAGSIAAAVAVLSAAIYDRQWTEPVGEPLRVSLVQGSISQDRKWLPEQLMPTLKLYLELTYAEIDSDLVVWPEVAVPAVANRVSGFLDEVDDEARRRNMQVYLGILTQDIESGQYRNSLIGLGFNRAEYHKRHLVPFGEFFPVPEFARKWMRSAGLPNQDTLEGDRDQQALPVGDYLMAPSICYEDAFGNELLDFLPESQLLINVSNDAWFGDSIAPHQHLQIAQVRALETGRSMLRATNTGITAIIGPDGRIVSQSPQFETDVLRADVQPRSGATPYVLAGNWPVVSGCLLLIGLAAFRAFGQNSVHD